MFKNTTKKGSKKTLKIISLGFIFISSTAFAIGAANKTSVNAYTLNDVDIKESFIYQKSNN